MKLKKELCKIIVKTKLAIAQTIQIIYFQNNLEYNYLTFCQGLVRVRMRHEKKGLKKLIYVLCYNFDGNPL